MRRNAFFCHCYACVLVAGGCSSRCCCHCLCMRQHICTPGKCKKGVPRRWGWVLYSIWDSSLGSGRCTFICVAESTARKFRKWMHENPNKTAEKKGKPKKRSWKIKKSHKKCALHKIATTRYLLKYFSQYYKVEKEFSFRMFKYNYFRFIICKCFSKLHITKNCAFFRQQPHECIKITYKKKAGWKYLFFGWGLVEGFACMGFWL